MSVPRRLPLYTLGLVAFAIAVAASETLAGRLAFERSEIQAGQLWRFFTGHLVHELPRLLQVDLIVLFLLGTWIEQRSRRLLGAALAASALLSSAALLLVTDYERYLGSSALGSGLLVAAVVLAFREGKRAVALGALALFGAKLGLEAFGLWPAVLGGLPAEYEPSSAAHLGGGLGGGLAALGTPTPTAQTARTIP